MKFRGNLEVKIFKELCLQEVSKTMRTGKADLEEEEENVAGVTLTAWGIHSHQKAEQGEASNLHTIQFCLPALKNQLQN